MKKGYLIILVLVAIIVAAGYVYAAKGVVKGKSACVAVCSDLCSDECTAGMGYGFGPKGLANVNPSPAQIKKLQKIHSDFIRSTKTARGRIQERMRELSSLWASGKGSESAVKSLIDGIESDRTTIRNAGIKSTFKALKVLDKKQIAKLRDTVSNGYVHLLSIGTRMSGGESSAVKKGRNTPACATGCRAK